MHRRMPNATYVPTAFAFFEVYVPTSSEDNPSDFERVVDRYLYAGFTRGEVEYSHEDRRYVVPVTYTEYDQKASDIAEHVRNRVQYQRDRLSSGLYGSTEPTLYLPVEKD